jgi:hypothetical protein
MKGNAMTTDDAQSRVERAVNALRGLRDAVNDGERSTRDTLMSLDGVLAILTAQDSSADAESPGEFDALFTYCKACGGSGRRKAIDPKPSPPPAEVKPSERIAEICQAGRPVDLAIVAYLDEQHARGRK